MTPDDALAYVAEHDLGERVSPRDWIALRALADEVRRLRGLGMDEVDAHEATKAVLWSANAHLESAREACERAALESCDGYLHVYIQRLRSELELKSKTSAEIAIENVRLRDDLDLCHQHAQRVERDLLKASGLLARFDALLEEWR